MNTLVTDIYNTIKKPGWYTPEMASYFNTNLALRLDEHLNEQNIEPRLRISKLGPRCPRALWCSIHKPEEETPVPAWAKNTFTYGHIVEMLTLTQIKASGHEVTGEQDELSALGIIGHRDCIVDGYLCDIKSCGRFGFNKFKTGSIAKDDLFGYLDQMDGYLLASRDDDLVQFKDRGYIIAVDKQLGHICTYEHTFREEHITERIKTYQSIVESPDPPQCTCKTLAFGASGNRKLDVQASYSVFRHSCFPHLRTFIYSDGPVHLSTVVVKPNVLEVDKYGNPV